MGTLPPGIRIDGEVVSFTSRAGMDRLGAKMMHAGANHMLRWVQAAQRGELAVAGIESPTASFPSRVVERWKRPAIILVGDDPWPNGEALGPDGWASARRLKYWRPQVAIIHGSGLSADPYRLAAEAAELVHRIVFIETDSAHVQVWADFLECPSTLRIVPPAGCSHPDKSAPRVLQ